MRLESIAVIELYEREILHEISHGKGGFTDEAGVCKVECITRDEGEDKEEDSGKHDEVVVFNSDDTTAKNWKLSKIQKSLVIILAIWNWQGQRGVTTSSSYGIWYMV